MITRYGSFPKVLKNMRKAMEVARLSHENIDTRYINQRAYDPID